MSSSDKRDPHRSQVDNGLDGPCTSRDVAPQSVRPRRLGPRVFDDLPRALQALTEYAPHWDYWIGDDGRYLYVSPACESVCGHPSEAFLDAPDLMTRLLHPEDRDAWVQHLDSVLAPSSDGRSNAHETMELRLLTPDGDIRWIEHCCQPVWDGEGRFLGRRGVNHDVTRLKETEDRLALGERSLHSLIQAAPVGVGVVRGRVFQEVNARLCEMVGYSREELLGHSSRMLYVSEEAFQRVGRDLYADLARDGSARIDTQLLHREGGLIDVVLSIAALDPLDIEQGQISTVMDVSGIKRTQSLLEARVALGEVAAVGCLDTLLRATLDTAERLTRSEIGFFHFVEPDQEQISLQVWSTNTIGRHCAVDALQRHYPVSEAGIWVDCLQMRAPVVHNDYAAVAHRRGLPEGHTPLLRELTVPVLRGGVVVAVVGVGNKPIDYSREDTDVMVQLADMTMDMVERMRDEEALRETNQRLLEAQLIARVGHWQFEVASGRFSCSPQLYEIFGLDPDLGVPDLAACKRILCAGDLDEFEEDVRCAVTLGVPYHRDWRLCRPDGSVCFVHAVCEPELDSAGAVSVLRGTVQDISERKRAEQELADARSRLELALDGGDMGIYDADLATGAIRVDERYLAMLGYAPEEIPFTSDTWAECLHPEDRTRVERVLGEVRSDGEDRVEIEYRMRHRSGHWVWILDRARVYAWDANGRPLRTAGTHLDITGRIESEARLRQAAQVFESTSEGVMIADPSGAVLAVNRAFVEITGYDEAEILGRNPRFLSSGMHDQAFYRNLWGALTNEGVWRGEIWNRRKNGEVFPEWLTISAVREGDGHVTHYVAVFSDITAVKRAQENLDYLAHHDALTGLPNRLLLKDRLDHSIARASRGGRDLALMFLDLDGFKNVNDTLGHAVGDELLVEVSRRMLGRLRGSDTLARHGGDEFLILLDGEPEGHEAATVAKALLELLAERVTVAGHDLYISASIGISFFPADGRDADTLLRSADLAMYRAKAAGRNNFQFYTPEMTDHVRERHEMENALRGAVERGEISIHYQPQVEIEGGRLCGVEALARWNHPVLGMVPPGRFIPIAEEIGIAGTIGDWVLESACRQVATWRAQGFLIPSLSVNLSKQQLERESLPEAVRRILEETALPASMLELEVTESTLMAHGPRMLCALEALRELGLSLAVDDFGSGYSSLGRLNRIPIDRLKIDPSFVRAIARDQKDQVIARAIIGLSKELGLRVIAEGVEQEDQADFLLRAGCAQAQGYLFGCPMPAQALADHWFG